MLQPIDSGVVLVRHLLQSRALRRGQPAAVSPPHSRFCTMQPHFEKTKATGFRRGKLSSSHSLTDPLFLPGLALIDWLGRSADCCSCGSNRSKAQNKGPHSFTPFDDP